MYRRDCDGIRYHTYWAVSDTRFFLVAKNKTLIRMTIVLLLTDNHVNRTCKIVLCLQIQMSAPATLVNLESVEIWGIAITANVTQGSLVEIVTRVSNIVLFLQSA